MVADSATKICRTNQATDCERQTPEEAFGSRLSFAAEGRKNGPKAIQLSPRTPPIFWPHRRSGLTGPIEDFLVIHNPKVVDRRQIPDPLMPRGPKAMKHRPIQKPRKA